MGYQPVSGLVTTPDPWNTKGQINGLVRTMFDHLGVVEVNHNWDEALDKVFEGIEKQTNHPGARFFFLPSGWVKEQAKWCTWAWYNGPRAERDAILLQT